MDDSDAERPVPALDSQREVADLPQVDVRIGRAVVRRAVVDREGQVSLALQILKLPEEAAYQPVVSDLAAGHFVHQLAAVDTPDFAAAEAILVLIDRPQDRDVVPTHG